MLEPKGAAVLLVIVLLPEQRHKRRELSLRKVWVNPLILSSHYCKAKRWDDFEKTQLFQEAQHKFNRRNRDFHNIMLNLLKRSKGPEYDYK